VIEIGTRKHGPFDTRYPRPLVATDRVFAEGERSSLAVWEDEGGAPRVPSLPQGLSWESFSALAYPGESRHYFPVIASWYRYEDGDRSWPRGSS